ncbi:FFAR3 protein, partial [Alcedo cyanopectus]|nr:FFAR3 protein [Ceyx cyanopectus]
MAEVASGMSWPFPRGLCPVANFCFYSSIYLSSLFLAALSVERVLGVATPLSFQSRGRWVPLASLLLWVVAFAHCSIVFAA